MNEIGIDVRHMGEFIDLFVPRRVSWLCGFLISKAELAIMALHMASEVYSDLLKVYECTYYTLLLAAPASLIIMKVFRLKQRALKYVLKHKKKVE